MKIISKDKSNGVEEEITLDEAKRLIVNNYKPEYLKEIEKLLLNGEKINTCFVVLFDKSEGK